MTDLNLPIKDINHNILMLLNATEQAHKELFDVLLLLQF